MSRPIHDTNLKWANVAAIALWLAIGVVILS